MIEIETAFTRPLTIGEIIVALLMISIVLFLLLVWPVGPKVKGNSIMLVLSRKPEAGEDVIRIGDDIVIQIQSVRGNHIKVGITAPQELRVLRGEIYEREHVGGPNIPQTFRPNMERAIDHAGEIMADSRS